MYELYVTVCILVVSKCLTPNPKANVPVGVYRVIHDHLQLQRMCSALLNSIRLCIFGYRYILRNNISIYPFRVFLSVGLPNTDICCFKILLTLQQTRRLGVIGAGVQRHFSSVEIKS